MVCRFPPKSAAKASKGPFQCAGQSGAVTYVKVGEVSEPEITPRSSTQAGRPVQSYFRTIVGIFLWIVNWPELERQLLQLSPADHMTGSALLAEILTAKSKKVLSPIG
jgi:hypothetical protein